MKNRKEENLLKGYSQKSAGLLIQSLRLSNNFTQSEFAKILQVSQSHISKIENGDLPLSLESWLLVERHFSVGLEALEKQYIDELIKKNGKLLKAFSPIGFNLKKKYTGDYITTVRGILPFINAASSFPHFFEIFQKKCGIKKSFLCDLNNPINFPFLRDFVDQNDEVRDIVQSILLNHLPTPYIYGDLHFKFCKSNDFGSFFSSFVKVLNSYSFDFHREMISSSTSSIVIESVKKSDHTLEDCVENYYSLLFENASKYISPYCQITSDKFANGTLVHQVKISDH